ncbi:PRD domain-containing protein [Aerococcaceae bacterium 50-4]
MVRIFNNNAVLAIDEEGDEVVAMGKGLGFSQHVGNSIDASKIEKIFKENAVDIPVEELFVTLSTPEIDSLLAIIDLATSRLKEKYQANLYITLADHIHFAVERFEKGMVITNPLAWNVRRLFPDEHQIGLQALDIIQEQLGVRLPDDEAASIALHLVNARMNQGEMSETMEVVKIVHGILEVVRLYFGQKFNTESIAYNRFMTHLQYFAMRVTQGEAQNGSGQFLYDQVKENYPKAMACAEKIDDYIYHQYAYRITAEEKSYLAIHVNRLIESN